MNKNLVYLVQADTTVGFSSQNDEKLSLIKQRPLTQKILQTVDSFTTLKRNTRIPKKFKNRVRRSTFSTFIYPNKNSFRVVDKNSEYSSFLFKFKQCFSTSANLTGKHFDEKFAQMNADVIVEQSEGFHELNSSSMYKISKFKIQKIR